MATWKVKEDAANTRYGAFNETHLALFFSDGRKEWIPREYIINDTDRSQRPEAKDITFKFPSHYMKRLWAKDFLKYFEKVEGDSKKWIKDYQRFLGKRVLVRGIAGKLEFLGYNKNVPEWKVQATIGRTPVQDVKKEDIIVLDKLDEYELNCILRGIKP